MGNVEAEAKYVRAVIKKLNKFIDRAIEEDAQTHGMNLTRPQVDVLEQLADTPGLSLKDLSLRMGLAQSTVSGIVDRLEKKQLVERRPDTDDQRVTRLFVSPIVRSYLDERMHDVMDTPLIACLSRASDEELERIRIGLSTLERLLSTEG
jgi:MarR family transcriptional regulator, organic hydroperoxide resistance regulator